MHNASSEAGHPPRTTPHHAWGSRLTVLHSSSTPIGFLVSLLSVCCCCQCDKHFDRCGQWVHRAGIIGHHIPIRRWWCFHVSMPNATRLWRQKAKKASSPCPSLFMRDPGRSDHNRQSRRTPLTQCTPALHTNHVDRAYIRSCPFERSFFDPSFISSREPPQKHSQALVQAPPINTISHGKLRSWRSFFPSNATHLALVLIQRWCCPPECWSSPEAERVGNHHSFPIV